MLTWSLFARDRALPAFRARSHGSSATSRVRGWKQLARKLRTKWGSGKAHVAANGLRAAPDVEARRCDFANIQISRSKHLEMPWKRSLLAESRLRHAYP